MKFAEPDPRSTFNVFIAVFQKEDGTLVDKVVIKADGVLTAQDELECFIFNNKKEFVGLTFKKFRLLIRWDETSLLIR